MVNIMLVAHHAMTCDGLHALLDPQPDVLVVATAADGDAALEAPRNLTTQFAGLSGTLDLPDFDVARRIDGMSPERAP